jgi:hypothetical protein
MDESAVHNEVHWLLITQQTVEMDLSISYVAKLIRFAYSQGYTAGLKTDSPDSAEAQKLVNTLYCRLPV